MYLAILAILCAQAVGVDADVRRAKEKLEKNPDDPAANLVIGRSLAVDGEWEKAVECLKKAKQSGMDKLFEKEAAAPASAADLIALGDEWLKAMSKAGNQRTLYRDRAMYWYAEAWPKLDAAGKEKLRAMVQKAQGYPAATVPLRKSAGKADRWNGFNDSTYSYLDTNFFYDGGKSGKLLTTGKEAENWFAFLATELFAPPPDGSEVFVTAWVYTSGTDRDGQINARYFDSNGKLLDQHGPVIEPDFPFWKKYSFKSKVPVGAKRMDVPFLHRSVPGVTWVDRVSVIAGGKEYVLNGSLEAAK